MKEKQSEDQTIYEYILQTVAEKKPENIAQLITLVQQEFHYSDKEILNYILTLQNERKIALKKEPVATANLFTYLVSRKALWYWATVALTDLTVALVSVFPENVYPISYLRITLGTFFALFMPGFAFTQMFFQERKLGVAERLGLSVGLSMGIVALDAFFLNFSPWEITLTSIVFSLTLLIVILATAAFLLKLIHLQTAKSSKPH